MSLEARINAAWYGRPGALWLLWPLELLFRVLSALRKKTLSPEHCGAPVVVVGNIAVGGSGKTPAVLAVCRYLQERGYKPGIVSRGYGGQSDHYPLLVDKNTPPALAGDEPCLMARRTGLPVAVAPDRPAAARLLVEAQGCDIIVSDDGLQHYRLARDLEILVIDGRRGLGNGHCLPVGPLREPASRVAAVDLCLVNGGGEEVVVPSAATVPRFDMQLRGRELVNVRSGERRDVAEFVATEVRVNALAGIGHPQRFFDTLKSLGFAPVAHPFPDHHQFVEADLGFTESLPIIMTEKDAVKCAAFATEQCWMLPVDAEIDSDFYTQLQRHLATLMPATQAGE